MALMQLVAQVLKLTVFYITTIGIAQCKAVKPKPSAGPKVRLTDSGTDLITILRCYHLFKTVGMSQKIIVFKIKNFLPKTAIQVVHALKYLMQLAALMYEHIVFNHYCIVFPILHRLKLIYFTLIILLINYLVSYKNIHFFLKS
jgi:hypothetical protein